MRRLAAAVWVPSVVGFLLVSADYARAGNSAKAKSEAWEVQNIAAEEGAQGFFLKVRCRDYVNEPVPTKSPSPGSVGNDESDTSEDDEGDYYYSRGKAGRCRLSDDDLSKLTFLPKVKFSISEDQARGFRVFGNFRKGSYKMRIAKGAASGAGAKLAEEYSWSFDIPARTPKVSFASNGRYLPKENWKSLALTYVNARKIKIEVNYIRPENLIYWLGNDSEWADHRTADLVARKVIDVPVKEDENGSLFLDLRTMVNQPKKGIYEVKVWPVLAADQKANNRESSWGEDEESNRDTQTERLGRVDVRRMMVTDINLIAKRQAKDGSYFVSVLSTDDAEPLRGAIVKAISSNGRVISECKTSKSGCVVNGIVTTDVDPAVAVALTASYDDDLTYLRFSDVKLDTSGANVYGPEYGNNAAYRAGLYGDRDIYRPGETVHAVAIVRDENNVAPKAGMPVVFNIRDSRGRLAQTSALKINAAGVVETSLLLDAAADTGEYRAEVLVAGKSVGSLKFYVEEFVPERIRIVGGFTKDGFVSTEAASLDFTAEYLFGGNAGGAGFEVSCELEPALFTPERNPNFSYGVWRPEEDEKRRIPLGMESGKLNKDGKGTAKCLAPKANARFAGMTNLVAKTSVFEAGSGRTTLKTFRVPMHPDSFYLGLLPSAKKLKSGDRAIVKGIIVDHAGNMIPQDRDIEVQFFSVKTEHNWSYDSAKGHYVYQRKLHPELESKSKVKAVGGTFEFPVVAARIAPEYLVRVQSGNARTEVQIEGSGSGYAWDFWEGGGDKTPGPMQATWLKLDAPKEIKVGQKTKMKVVFPYRGYALMSVETDKVLTSEWVEIEEAGTFEWEFKVDEFQPNVYVSALLVKDPHQESKDSYLPERAYGIRSIKITPEKFQAKLGISAPEKVLPQSKLTVNLNLKGGESGSYVTLAAVDEGILQLTGFKSPEPLEILLAQRGLGVETFETVGWNFLFPSQPNTSKTGGDTGLGRGDAALPRPVKPVALWSGLLPIDKDGNATVTFDVPMFRGELRLMAVAMGKSRIATAVGKVTVTEPIVMQPTTPRFLAIDDEIEIPVFVTNTTNAPRTVEVALAVEHFDSGSGDTDFDGSLKTPITILGENKRSLNVGKSSSGTVRFRLRAEQAYGGAKLKFVARSGDITAFDEAEIPLTHAAPKTKEDRVVPLSSEVQPLIYPLFEKGTDRATILLTTNPYSKVIAQHLPSLIHYPYGCIEQTTSTTRPLIYLPELVANIDPALAKIDKIREYVRAGIRRILGMQTASGGFAYWPGSPNPDEYGTIIATQVLMDAQKAGYQVPEERVRSALKYLGRRLVNEFEHRDPKKALERSWYGWDVEPYLHYLLARSGDAHKARIEKLLEASTVANFENVYLLKAALYVAGDKRYERDLRMPEVPSFDPAKMERWGYYSDLRAMGFVLNLHTDLFPGDKSALRLADDLARGLSYRPSPYWWFSTQELTWGITALGKMAQGGSLNAVDPNLFFSTNKKQRRIALNGGKEWMWRVRNPMREPLRMEVKRGTLPGNAFVVMSSEGVSIPPVPASDANGMRVSREYLNMAGERVDLSKPIRLGEIIVSKIEVENTSAFDEVRNVVLTDRFPAAFEVENPRIGRGKALGWLNSDDLWKTEYTDVRDDRVSFFGTLERQEKRVVVTALRATALGKFLGGSTEAQAMYDSRLFARIPGVTVTVEGTKNVGSK